MKLCLLQFHAATWTGRMPEGTAAIIHSHPRTLPNPSQNDILEAHRLGIPVIVVTPDAVTMVLPRDGTLVHANYDSSRMSFRAP
ncbi:MAG TPA: Mov34/MPN/PAD-1 family protein [Thermoanaerobaculia bacterium]